MVEAETKPEGENVLICNDYNQALPTQRALRSTAAQKASNSAPRVVFRCSDNPHGEQRTSLLEERTNLSLCFFAGFTLYVYVDVFIIVLGFQRLATRCFHNIKWSTKFIV